MRPGPGGSLARKTPGSCTNSGCRAGEAGGGAQRGPAGFEGCALECERLQACVRRCAAVTSRPLPEDACMCQWRGQFQELPRGADGFAYPTATTLRRLRLQSLQVGVSYSNKVPPTCQQSVVPPSSQNAG